MKFGVRIPSIKKRFAARTSVKRLVRSKIRAPKGFGVVTDPKKFIYNKVYNKTSVGVENLAHSSTTAEQKIESKDKSSIHTKTNEDGSLTCPRCGANMGQPKSKGLFFKRVYFECHIKALVVS